MLSDMFNKSSPYFTCITSLNGIDIISAYGATSALLLLPLSALVLYVGFQRWRHQQSTSMVTRTSHLDFVTYHMVALELLGQIGCGCYCYGSYMGNENAVMSGFFIFALVLPGEALFHCLTCVERYLAVVHPIIYLNLRKTGGVRIRNISIGCVWLICVGWVGVAYLYFPDFPTLPFFLLYTSSLLVSSFCSLFVLYTLTHPGPGKMVGHKVDQSKQRAFHTIMAIMVTHVLRFCGIIVCIFIFKLMAEKAIFACVVMKSTFWFCLPSSLVLPLLFLHRAGKLECFKQNTESR